jgi:lambda family phage tail tape measure protein
MAGDLSQQIVFGADTTGVEAGVERVKKTLAGVGVAATDAGKKASAAVDSIGNGAGGSSQKVESATKNLVASIQRQIAAFEAGGRSSSKFYEQLANQRGVSVDTIRPLLDQLKEAKSKFEEAGHGAEELSFKTAGAKRELLVLAHELSQGNFKRFGGSLLVLGEQTGAAGLLFSKTTLAILGTAAAVAVLGEAVAHAEVMQRTLNTLATQLAATGRAGLLSTDQLKTFIKELALMPGVTKESATEIISEFTKVHQIGGSLFTDLVKITADYAKATGTEAPAAAKALAQAFADPEKGAKALDAALGTLTSAQLLQIEKMTQQNDLAGAQRVLYEALEQSVKGLADRGLTPLEKATNDLGNAWHTTMGKMGESNSLKVVNSLLVDTLGLVRQLVEAIPRLGGLSTIGAGLLPGMGSAASISGGLAAYLRNKYGPKLGIGGADTQTGGATGSWDAPSLANAAANGPSVDDRIKSAIKLGSAYESVGHQIEGLTRKQAALREAQALAAKTYGKDSAQYKELASSIEGVGEAIERLKNKGAAKEKAFHDDAATKMLETLRQTEASLKAQLSGQDKLTEAQKEQAKFQQLIADLKEKKILTADQKSLLTAKDAIGAQLAINVELDKQIANKEKAKKLAQEEAAFAQQMLAITRTIQSAQEARNEQYQRQLSTAGLGDRAAQQVLAQKDIYNEFIRNMRSANDKAAHASEEAKKNGLEFDAFNSDEYKKEVATIKAALEEGLAALQRFYARDKAARENWVNGATKALANYVDHVNDAAGRANQLLTTGLVGLTDSITGALMGDKGKGFKDLGKHIAEEITHGIVEQQITKPIAEWLQGSLKDGSSLIGKLLGGLTSNKTTGENWLGGGIGGASAASATTGLATAATSAAAALSSLTAAAGGASFGSAASGLFGSSAAAMAGANAVGDAGGDSLGALIALNGWASGGYTGSGGKFQPAVVVHKGEYVMTAESTSRLGVNFLERLNRRGYADGGFVSGVMGGNLSGSSSSQQAGGSRTVQVVMNVPKGTDTRTAGQWGAAAARQIRMAEARHS